MTRRRPRLARSRRPWDACLLALLLLVVAAGVRAQSPTSLPTRGTLVASLLTAHDLPGFAGRDLGDPSDLDIDRLAFDAQRGIEHIVWGWASQAQGVVFDHRMLFPTPMAALAYLATAEPTLSEADDAGLALVSHDPLTPATRHWAGETLIGAERVAMDVWLIPVGPVVAKVAATVFGPALADRRMIAERALARLEAAVGPTDGVGPSGSPSDPPRASPAVSAVSDIDLLQSLVQAVLRTSARGCEDARPGLPGEVVALSCTTGDVVVVYRRFRDSAVRDAAYATLLAEVPTMEDAAASRSEGAYRGSVTEGGRTWAVGCRESTSGLVLLWTEPDQPTLGAILAPPFSDLVGLARRAGPGSSAHDRGRPSG